MEKLRSIPGVAGIVQSSRQLHIILGPGTARLFGEMAKETGLNSGEVRIPEADNRNRGRRPVRQFLRRLANIFVPLIPAIISGGMIMDGAFIAAACTGVAYLAEAGLLDGHQATTHWGVADLYRQRYPKVRWRTEQFVTEDGRIFCSGGVYASIDLSLYLVEKFCGHEIALKVAKSLLLSMPRGRQSGYSVVQLSRPHSDEKIRQTEEYLQQHFDSDISIEQSRRTCRNGSAQFHPPLQGGDRPRAWRLHPDAAGLGSQGTS